MAAGGDRLKGLRAAGVDRGRALVQAAREGREFRAGPGGFWAFLDGKNVRFAPGDPLTGRQVTELMVRGLVHLPVEVVEAPGE